MAKPRKKALDSHPIANVWPSLNDQELEDLAEDIKANGLHHPVVLYEEKILDGRNRAKACELAGVALKTTKYRGEDPVGYAVSLNEKRRHLSSSQRAALAAEMKPYFEAEAKKRQQAAGGNNNPLGKNQYSQKEEGSLVEKVPQASRKQSKQPIEKSRARAAKTFDTNENYVNKAEKIKRQSPEVFDRVKKGELNIPQASRIISAAPEEEWSESELERKQKVENGQAVLANEQNDLNLVAWAKKENLDVKIDSNSWWANPFILNEDGNRDEIFDLFEQNYLPIKKSFLKRSKRLKGKVLICQCFPLRCHGEALLKSLDEWILSTEEGTDHLKK